MISKTYFSNAKVFRSLEVVACADINDANARERAEEFGCTVMPVEDLISSSDIDIVLNLTVPKAHVEIGSAALSAGKHVHCEKPLGVNRDEARALLERSRASGLRVGSAPDTFLGAGHQTSRKLVDDGWIGKPLFGLAALIGPGPQSWHPTNPFSFFERGGGPLFDMGPYYLTALVNLLGPVKSVTARTSAGFAERVALSERFFGTRIPVEVNTHATGVLEFTDGTLVTVVFTWDCKGHAQPRFELHGTEGSLELPNPNAFGGPVRVQRSGGLAEVPLTHGYSENSRLIGVADMAKAIENKRPHRTSGELAFHVLDVMCAFDESSHQGKTIEIQSTCERPAALPTGLLPGEID